MVMEGGRYVVINIDILQAKLSPPTNDRDPEYYMSMGRLETKCMLQIIPPLQRGETCYKHDKKITKNEQEHTHGTKDFNVENPLQQK
jgi:hypothetical protein